MFDEEMRRIEVVTNKAFEEAVKGNFSKAERIISKVRKSWCVTESVRSSVLIESYTLLQKKKKKRAKQIILNNNFAAWGSPDLLHILRLCNPAIDQETKLFQLTLKGGYATFGAFSQFSNEHACELEVVANSETEALNYAKELCRFAEPERVSLLSLVEFGCPEDESNRGILKTNPFKLVERRSAQV